MKKLSRLILYFAYIIPVIFLVACDGGGGNNNTTTTPTTYPPAAPSNLSASAVSSSQINLTWTDNSSDEDGFKIERKTGASGTYTQIDTVGSNVTSYQNTGLSAATTYYYRVRAYNSGGDSGYSNEANATTEACVACGPLVSIPAGCFNMGDAFPPQGGPAELPVHNVCLSAFEMNRHLVTVGEYKACVTEGTCTVPGNTSSFSRAQYYDNPSGTYDNFPVITVDWYQASAYCSLAGGRLPTEAEWEYAARGGLSGKRYPWGDTISCDNANYDRSGSSGSCYNYGGLANDTSPVEYYAANGYGLYDMAGNVWEWANDWYDTGYYSVSPVNDPPGPASGTYRVIRGGSWIYDAGFLRSSTRHALQPAYDTPYSQGFRCVRTP